MQGRNEVEEILEQEAWAARNGLDRPFSALERPGPVYLPPAKMLRDHELRTYRDCPAPDAYDELQVVPLGWLAMGWLVFVGLTFALAWHLTRH